MTIGRAVGFVISVIVVGGVVYYIWGQSKAVPLRELPEPILRIRRPIE